MKNKFHLIMAFVAAFACSAPSALNAAISKKSPSPAPSPSVSPSPKSQKLTITESRLLRPRQHATDTVKSLGFPFME